jgi:hypothetical protein
VETCSIIVHIRNNEMIKSYLFCLLMEVTCLCCADGLICMITGGSVTGRPRKLWKKESKPYRRTCSELINQKRNKNSSWRSRSLHLMKFKWLRSDKVIHIVVMLWACVREVRASNPLGGVTGSSKIMRSLVYFRILTRQIPEEYLQIGHYCFIIDVY